MPRLKTIEKDGAKYDIAPLNLAQVDELFDLLRDPERQAEAAFFVVAAALNNARAVSGRSDSEWDRERIRKELDLVTLPWIHAEALAFSALKAAPAAGETKAAPVLPTSPESAAA